MNASCLSPHFSVSILSLSVMTLPSKTNLLSMKETACKSQEPSSSNLWWDIISFVESHSKTRCADQPYLIAVGCVCVCVCVHIRLHYKNRLPGSICAQCAGKLGKQGSPWPSVLLLPPAFPSCV